MKTVWKFPLKPGKNEFMLPKHSSALTVSAMTGEPCLWALVDPSQEKVPYTFLVLGTGHEGPDDLYQEEYIGTFFVRAEHIGMMMGLPPVLVYHVFMRKPVDT